MSKIISILQQDHSHFLKILDTLERQIRRVAHGDAVDRKYFRCILEYFNGYPRRVHYMREEMLLRMLEERSPHLCAKIDVVLKCHRTLDARLESLEETFRHWERDPVEGRAAFVTAAIRFLEFERNHFADEEEHLFPVARTVLSDADLSLADTTLPKDPASRFFSARDPSLPVEDTGTT